MDSERIYYRGSCLCKAVCFELLAEPVTASHCYCSMCQKQHGAAFASYARVRQEEFRYTRGQNAVKRFASSGAVERCFCSECGSNLTWGYTEGEWSEWLAVALGCFDTPYTAAITREIHLDDMAPWWEQLAKARQT
ncbi:GFA family protein [Pseudoteredinibacter isoporae]|uniref:GFA family protein n=1 Tax=Pseudoteredinibacter isoporae TaxID=570281 RepID=UPI00333E3651